MPSDNAGVKHNSGPDGSASKKTAIALILDSAPRTWTSQEEIHLRLCRALRDLGITPVLVYADKLSAEIETPLKNAGAIIEVATYGRGVFDYFRALRKIFVAHRVSLVHVCFFDYFSLVPWLVRLTGIKAVLFEQLNSGMLKATSWRKRLIQLRAIFAIYPAVQVVAISYFVKSELAKCGVANDKIIVRHLGVDTERFHPDPAAREKLASEFSIQSSEIILSTVSVMRAFKNPGLIIRACGLLAARGVPFRLFVAGDGDMVPELKRLAEQEGIAQQTHWLGYCADPKALLQASDIFLLASIGEAFGLVLAEAMACEVPVVGSQSGAIPEIVEDGHTGFLAPPDDPVAFADAIEKLARNKELRERMGINSLNRVREKFDVDLDVRNTIKIYDALQ